MLKNTASQTFHVKAFNEDGLVTGDAANITCELAIDGGTRSATNDVNPTEIGSTGEYVFTLTQAETNGHELSFTPVSATPGVQVLGMPGNVIYTTVLAPTVAEIGTEIEKSGGMLKTLSDRFTGVTSYLSLIRLLARSDAGDSTAKTELGGTYDETTDSLQAIRDRGDVSWAKYIPEVTTVQFANGDDEEVRVPLRPLDATGAIIEDIEFDDADLEVEVLADAGTGFVAKTLVTATSGTWAANGFIYIDGGIYEYGLEASVVEPGTNAFVRVRYDSDPWQYTEIRFLTNNRIDMSQATPDGNTVGSQLDAITLTTDTDEVPINTFPTATFSTALTSSVVEAGDTITRYTGSTWTFVFRPLPVIPNGDTMVFSIKANKETDADEDSVIEITYDVTSETTTITYLNGAANGSEVLATITEAENTEDSDTRQMTLVIDDSVTAEIQPGTYDMGLKRVGTSIVYLDDELTVSRPVTRAYSV